MEVFQGTHALREPRCNTLGRYMVAAGSIMLLICLCNIMKTIQQRNDNRGLEDLGSKGEEAAEWGTSCLCCCFFLPVIIWGSVVVTNAKDMAACSRADPLAERSGYWFTASFWMFVAVWAVVVPVLVCVCGTGIVTAIASKRIIESLRQMAHAKGNMGTEKPVQM